MTDYVKSSPVAEGFPYEKVLYPGEKEAMTRQERSAQGIDIEDTTWDLITSVMREYGVSEA
jgi:LDH2 family malate/lactate/ureidoglycolate dehydrogenase